MVAITKNSATIRHVPCDVFQWGFRESPCGHLEDEGEDIDEESATIEMEVGQF